MYVNFTPIAAGSGRSPLVSLMFPTLKDKITNVERFCEDVGPGSSSFSQGASMRSRPKFLPALELEKIVQKKMERDAMTGMAVTGGAVLAVGGILGLAMALAKR